MSQAVPVLMYHHVSPNPGLVTVSPKTFAEQMSWIARAGYRTLTADEFVSFLRNEKTVPRKSVLITFDDGFLDNYVYAYPELLKHGFRATFFLVTGWISDGTSRLHAGKSSNGLPGTPKHYDCVTAIREGRADEVMMRWAEIEAMHANGLEFYSHTHSHLRWDQIVAGEQERMRRVHEDLITSRDTLKTRLGSVSPHLCWPWGFRGAGYVEAAERAGFSVQYTTQRGVNVTGTDPRHIFRHVIKDRAGRWFAQQLWTYRQGLLGALYSRLRGK